MNLISRLLAVFSLVFSGCAGSFQPMKLEDSYMTTLHGEEKGEDITISGKPILKHKNGDLLDGRYWWGGEGITVIPQKQGIEVTFINTGPKYTPFGADLPLLDLVKQPVAIRLKARAEGKDGDVPMLTLQFDDAEGFQANAKRPAARIGNSDEYLDYYLDCSHMWRQNWPDNHDVNGGMVNKMMFFINPGSSGYTGKIFIKEMQAIPLDSMKANPEFKIPAGIEGGLVDNFDAPGLKNWNGGGEKYTLSRTDEGALKVIVRDAGPGYPSFVKKLDKTMNMKNAYKIRMKVRFEGEGYPELRVDAKDFNGYITNGKPASNWLEPTENGQYRDYLFVFKDSWFQAYPERKDMDPERITDLLFFVNPGKNAWSGTIFIDDIEVIYTGSSGRNSER